MRSLDRLFDAFRARKRNTSQMQLLSIPPLVHMYPLPHPLTLVQDPGPCTVGGYNPHRTEPASTSTSGTTWGGCSITSSPALGRPRTLPAQPFAPQRLACRVVRMHASGDRMGDRRGPAIWASLQCQWHGTCPPAHHKPREAARSTARHARSHRPEHARRSPLVRMAPLALMPGAP
eukprot:gene16311-biopygen11289